MKPLAIGLVGFGKIAHDQHVPAIRETDGLELVAVSDPTAIDESLPSYRTMEAMLDAHPEIAVVSLCMPPSGRAETAARALAKGKHVLLEKPPAASLADAQELETLTGKNGVTLFTAWHSQHGSAVSAARDWIAGQQLCSVQVYWKEDVRVWHPGQAWIWREGGFGVFDPGINALSILTAILPGSLSVTETELFVPSNRATPIAANLVLETDDGVTVSAEFDFLQTGPQSWDIEVEAKGGRMRLSLGGNRLVIDGKMQEVGEEAEYRSLYAHFLSLIENGKSDIDLAPLKLVEDAFSIGRVVSVEPFEE